jgi:hypothetical protein
MYAFELTRAKTVADAAAALAKSGGKALAGGQSLVGAMKLRLAQPGTLVDLSGIAELKGIRKDGDALVVGAMTRHAEVAASPEVKSAIPVLAALAQGIGDRQVRNMGTLGGSIAHKRSGGRLARRGARARRDGDYQQAQDRGRRFLQRHVRDGARRGRGHDGGELSRAEEGRLHQVPESRVAIRARRRVRCADGKRSPRRRDGRGAVGIPVEAARGCAGKSFTADAAKAVKIDSKGLNATCTARRSIART